MGDCSIRGLRVLRVIASKEQLCKRVDKKVELMNEWKVQEVMFKIC